MDGGMFWHENYINLYFLLLEGIRDKGAVIANVAYYVQGDAVYIGALLYNVVGWLSDH